MYEDHLKSCPYCRAREYQTIQSRSKGASSVSSQHEDIRRRKLVELGKIIRGEAGLSKV